MAGLIAGIARFEPGPDLTPLARRLVRCLEAEASIGPPRWAHPGGASLMSAELVPEGGSRPTRSACSLQPCVAGDITLRDAVEPQALFDSLLGSSAGASLADIDADFAIAAWQPAGAGRKGRLLLARDIVGIRPLFYVVRDDWVAFCSLSLPLIRAGIATGEPNAATLAKIQLWNFDTGSQTFAKDVQRVPPAHVVEITARGVEARPYWRPRVTRPIASSADPRQLADQLRSHLDRAIRRRLPPSGPAATHLSGGLDSSTIAALAAEALAAEGRRIVGCFVEPEWRDDLHTVGGGPQVAALKQHHPNLDLARFETRSFASHLLAELRPDAPLPVDGSANHWEQTFAEAGRRGIPVVFSGFGGDETASFKGEGGMVEALLSGEIRAAMSLLRDLAAADRRPRWWVLGRELTARALPPQLRSRLRGLAGELPDVSHQFSRFLTPEGRRLAKTRRRPWTARAHRRDLLVDGRLAQNAEILATNAARHGVAVAFPFLDREVIEFTLRLPPTVFCRDGTRRWILRQAMEDRLPDMIRTRTRKLPMDNTSLHSLAASREAMLREVDRLEGAPAGRVFDIAALRGAIAALPTEGEARRQTNDRARQGDQPDVLPAILSRAFLLARFLGDAPR